MNSKTSKQIRRLADKSGNPKKAYKVLKGMYMKKEIALVDMDKLKIE